LHQAHRCRRPRCSFEAGLSRGEGALRARPCLDRKPDSKGDYGFLNLKGPAFDLSDRGVSGRPPARLDAVCLTERGVYRSGETVHITSLLRDPLGVAASNIPLTLGSSGRTASNIAAPRSLT